MFGIITFRRKLIRISFIFILINFIFTIHLMCSFDTRNQVIRATSQIFSNSKLKDNQLFEEEITKLFWKYSKNKKNFTSETIKSDLNLILSYNLWTLNSSGQNLKFMNDENGYYDRVLVQITLMNILERYFTFFKPKIMRILIYDSFNTMGFIQGDYSQSCPTLSQSCEYIDRYNILRNSSNKTVRVDSLLFYHNWMYNNNMKVDDKITRIFYTLESNFHSHITLERDNDILASYWRGSHIVTPYAKWAYYDERIKSKEQSINYADGKTKLVGMFVSNCEPVNERLDFANELRNWVQVDIYGRCGSLHCPKSDSSSCMKMLKKDYKFHLSFENSNCRDYITEKVFNNALRNNVVPIVLGAHPDDYSQTLPLHSFISVESFSSVQELANYLIYLNSNDTAYNEYFKWRNTGEFVDLKFFCTLCAMLHYGDLVGFPKRDQEFQWEDYEKRNMCRESGENYWLKNTVEIFKLQDFLNESQI